MKRIISLCLIYALLIACTGCGSSSLPADSPTGDDSTSSAVEVDATITEDTQSPDVELQSPDTTAPEEDANAQEDTEEPLEEEPYVRVIDPSKPMVALTFDDGPHETCTDQILDVLESNRSVATFFEVGRNVRAYPEPVQRMAELGCEVASHSYRHADLTTLGWQGMLDDLQKTDNAFIDAIGTAPILVRPPYGAVNKNVRIGSGRCMITWSVDPQDWRSRDAEVLIDYLQNFGSLDGEVVLLHSIHQSTADAMETLIPWLIEEGYQLVTVSELLAYYYGVLPEAGAWYDATFFKRTEKTDAPLELPEIPPQIQIPASAPSPSAPVQPQQPSTPPEEPSLPESSDPLQPPSDGQALGSDAVSPDMGNNGDPTLPPTEDNIGTTAPNEGDVPDWLIPSSGSEGTETVVPDSGTVVVPPPTTVPSLP